MDTKRSPLLSVSANDSDNTLAASKVSKCDVSGWATAIAAAIPMLVLSYSSCVSYGELIVAGSPLSASIITSLHLMSSGVSGLILPLTSRCPLMVPSADISVTIFYQAVVKDIVDQLAEDGATQESVTATAMLALPLSTMATSLIFFLIGQFRLTDIVAYVPYSVVAGFLGTIGWSIFGGSFAVLAGHKVSVPSELPGLVTEMPKQLTCALLLALGSMALKRCGISPIKLAIGPLVASISLFWIVVMSSGCTLESLREESWMFPESGFHDFKEIWKHQDPQLVIWSQFLPVMSKTAGLAIVLVLSLTLRTAGAEGSTGTILDMDAEMKWTGVANIGIGAAGGVIGSVSPGLTTFNVAVGSTDARASLLTGAFTLLLWLSGLPILNVLPRFLLSGILMNLGISMLIDWLWVSRNRLGASRLVAAYVQVGFAVTHGLMTGVLVGLGFACVAVWLELIKVNALKYHVSGESVTSRLSRTPKQIKHLNKEGHQIQILGLEGYLGTGPLVKLGRYLKEFIDTNRKVKYVILDFKYCPDCNPSGLNQLKKLAAILVDMEIVVIYCALAPDIAEGIQYFGDKTLIFAEQTEAMKYCEDALLQAAPESKARSPDSNGWANATGPALNNALETYLLGPKDATVTSSWWSPGAVERLEQLGTWSKMAAGTVLATEGCIEDKIYLAAPGFSEITEEVNVHQANNLSVAIDLLGAVCGVDGVLYQLESRSSSRVTRDDSYVFEIPSEAVQNLGSEDPELFEMLVRLSSTKTFRCMDVLKKYTKLSSGGGWQGAILDACSAAGARSVDYETKEKLAKGLAAASMSLTKKFYNVHRRGSRNDRDKQVKRMASSSFSEAATI